MMSVVVICQRKSRHWKESIFIYFEANAGVIVNVKVDVKGFGGHETSESRAFRGSQQTGEHDRDG